MKIEINGQITEVHRFYLRFENGNELLISDLGDKIRINKDSCNGEAGIIEIYPQSQNQIILK